MVSQCNAAGWLGPKLKIGWILHSVSLTLLLFALSGRCSSGCARFQEAKWQFLKGNDSQVRLLLNDQTTDIPCLILICRASFDYPGFPQTVERASHLAASNPEVTALLGLLRIKQGEEMEGKQLLEKALQSNVFDEVTLECCAKAYDALFDQANTEKFLGRLVAAYPSARHWDLRGQFFERSGQPEKARECYSRALSIDPSFEHALQNRARSFFHQGFYKQAQSDCTKCINLHPADEITSDCFRLRASCSETLKQYPDAIADYKEYLRRKQLMGKPKSDVYNTVYLGLTRNLIALKQYSEAEKYLERLQEKNSDVTETFELDAQIKEFKHDYRGAIADYDKLLHSLGDKAEWKVAKARLEKKLKD
jgi:tetratricopeptide (TPR) repeat protein